MRQIAENENKNCGGLTDFLLSELREAQASESGLSMSMRGVQSFVGYACGGMACEGATFDAMVGNWVVWLRSRGLSGSTVQRYLKGLSGVYNRAVKLGLAAKTPVFGSLMRCIGALGNEGWREGISPGDFKKFLKLTRGSVNGRGGMGADMALFALLSGGMPIAEVTMVKSDALRDAGGELRAIADRNHEATRRYLFALQQSMRTPRQVATEAVRLVEAFLITHGVRCFGGPDDTLRSYWAYAALAGGAAPREVLSALGEAPGGVKWLEMCGPAEPAAASAELREAVGNLFVANPLRWFAMRLRSRVKYADLLRRFSLMAPEVKEPELFYPCNEIARRVGRRMVFEDQPVISDVVFFRSRVTDILPLFSRIGDLAWCYKVSHTAGAPYAAVSDASFLAFQQAIGHFTADYPTASAGSLQVDDEAMVVGGPLAGVSGTVVAVEPDTPDGIIRYLLRILGPNGLILSYKADGRMIAKSPRRNGSAG